MTPDASLTGQFLIAMPALNDPNFQRSVTYLCEHNEEGALGIVINHPMSIVLSDLLDQLDVEITDPASGRLPIYDGGPVQMERGFVLHQPTGQWDSTMLIHDDIAITTSRDVLESLAKGKGPERVLVALGYAGWGAGQLEHEMSENAWLAGPATAEIVFDTPIDQRWHRAAALLGVDLNLIHGEAGHA